MRISPQTKQRAIQLRFQGRSYNDIRKILGLRSKGTLSYWFKNLKLSAKAQQLLADKISLARERGLFRFNTLRTKAIQLENKKLRERGMRAIPKFSRQYLFLISVALYWGEGAQSERNKNSLSLSISNSNPYIIALFLRFLREILEVKETRIKARIQVHPNIKKEKALKFWHKVTKLPIENFSFFDQISRASRFKRPSNFLPYGTFVLRVNDRRLFYKMKGYIDGLASWGRGN